jgi:hypothetical protein
MSLDLVGFEPLSETKTDGHTHSGRVDGYLSMLRHLPLSPIRVRRCGNVLSSCPIRED